jgi:hypothetical protein
MSMLQKCFASLYTEKLLVSVHKTFGSIPGNHSLMHLSMLLSLLQWLPRYLWIIPSEYFLVMAARKSWAVMSPGTMADASKPSHCAWQGTFLPPTTDVQVNCHAEETGCFHIFLYVSFSLDLWGDGGILRTFLSLQNAPL